jgi:hypothetical protein
VLTEEKKKDRALRDAGLKPRRYMKTLWRGPTRAT